MRGGGQKLWGMISQTRGVQSPCPHNAPPIMHPPRPPITLTKSRPLKAANDFSGLGEICQISDSWPHHRLQKKWTKKNAQNGRRPAGKFLGQSKNGKKNAPKMGNFGQLWQNFF